MLYVVSPEVWEIQVFDLFDKPVFDGVYSDEKEPDTYGKPKPLTQLYQNFLMSRLASEEFYEFGGKKEGLDAQEIIRLARRQIKEACREPHLTFQGFDDEVARRLQNSILKPKRGHLSSLETEHNWYDWVLLWKKLYPEPPAVLVMPEPVAGLIAEAT